MAASGDRISFLYANNGAGGSNYTIEVVSSSCSDTMMNLARDGIYDWSRLFTAANAFAAADDGDYKAATGMPNL